MLRKKALSNGQNIPKALLSLSLLATLASSSCKPLPQGQSIGKTSNITIESSGISRSYLISIPPAYDCETLTPVILSFHGANRNALQQQRLSQMSNTEFNNFAIAIYPLGLNETWQGVPGNSANDLQLVTDILDLLEQNYSIDPARIWSTGKSDGGGFCNTLACDPILSKRIAAFAPVSGAFYVDKSNCDPNSVVIPCNAGRPKIPIIEFHGYQDGTIAYGGGGRKSACLPTIPHWAQEWALRDGLPSTNTTVNVTSDTLLYTFGEGNESGLVTQVTDFKLAHDWESTIQVGDVELASFNATPIIVNFFKQHPLETQNTTTTSAAGSGTGSSTSTSGSSKPTGNSAPGLRVTRGMTTLSVIIALAIVFF